MRPALIILSLKEHHVLHTAEYRRGKKSFSLKDWAVRAPNSVAKCIIPACPLCLPGMGICYCFQFVSRFFRPDREQQCRDVKTRYLTGKVEWFLWELVFPVVLSFVLGTRLSSAIAQWCIVRDFSKHHENWETFPRKERFALISWEHPCNNGVHDI